MQQNTLQPRFIEITKTTDPIGKYTYINANHVTSYGDDDQTECVQVMMTNGVGFHIQEHIHVLRDRLDGFQPR